ncbi:hypothetical protein BZG36_05720 [Bifiguratus adelaidae]|uniref:Prion-inhibition and propagation HeLo domain-containing protein n=1 Tax=Bifiguratus adelaidae TaxID=1938954 RepID=A0A261XT71_9FUNG|nr:hypothetical protein BZG36_05720 [Bifiguratus adelaidae]
MEPATLSIAAKGVVLLWNTSVQVFDTVATARRMGMDYEKVLVKLEVERVRLLSWGQAVGLANVKQTETDLYATIDPRLNEPEFSGIVMRLLGCIQKVFDDTEQLQKKYGLTQLANSNARDVQIWERQAGADMDLREDNHFGLGSVFKRAYTSLQKSAKDYQQSSTLKRKVEWAITDKTKFEKLVIEVSGFNNGLMNLFPDVMLKAKRTLLEDIYASDEVASLILLQDASADEHAEISDTASVRLKDLKVNAIESKDNSRDDTTEFHLASSPPPPNEDQEADDELVKAVESLEVFSRDKTIGQLTCTLIRSDWTSHCRVLVSRISDDNFDDKFWIDGDKGFVQMPHDSLNIYRKKKFFKQDRNDKYESLTSEDYIYLDIEGDPKYDNVNPGTVTIEGYGLECWAYEVQFGKQHTNRFLVNYGDLPEIPAEKLLRRLHELKLGVGELGWSPQRDYEELKEYTGTLGITYYDPKRAYEITDQIMNLYSLLNRSDGLFSDFVAQSSIGWHALMGPVGLWNFLWQIILGKELARRLEHFPSGDYINGLTPQVLLTLIVSDLWLKNVEIVLVPKKGSTTPSVSTNTPSANNPFDIEGKEIQFHSAVHEKQVDGLFRFAEILKWPFMNELRDYAEDVYSSLRGGATVNLFVWDWLFGVVLPGAYTASNIMAALVLCTPSLSEELGAPIYLQFGLSLPNQSYWRTRTVLGRILGCLPGVRSACGWIGPCPPLEGPHRKYISLKTRPVEPPRRDDTIIRIGDWDSDDDDEKARLQAPEELYAWIEEQKDESSWVTPQPPVRQLSVSKIASIRVKPLPLDKSTIDDGDIPKAARDQKMQYRASIVFNIDNESPVTYTLYTNPVFVTPPRCNGSPHKVHVKKIQKFHHNIWNIEALKEASAEDYDNNSVMIINATGVGAEAVARAWCSERGKSAVIRRNPGPCFACAYKVASTTGLGINVLIWVS